MSEMPKPWEGYGWLQNGEPKWCQEEMVREWESPEDEESDDESEVVDYAEDTDDS